MKREFVRYGGDEEEAEREFERYVQYLASVEKDE